MRISDWSADVCSSDLGGGCGRGRAVDLAAQGAERPAVLGLHGADGLAQDVGSLLRGELTEDLQLDDGPLVVGEGAEQVLHLGGGSGALDLGLDVGRGAAVVLDAGLDRVSGLAAPAAAGRKGVVSGKRVYVRVTLGGR